MEGQMAKNNKGMQRFRVSCTGISPMLQNPMTDDILDTLLHGKAGRSKAPERDTSVEKIAEQRLCKGPNGELGIPSNYLFASLVEAGRQVIFDKKTKMSTRESSLVPAFLSIIEEESGMLSEFIPFSDQSVKWTADKRKGVLKSGAGGGVAVCIVRPKFNIWAFDVVVEVDLDQVNLEKVIDLFNKAGMFAGLGDFRPSKRGPFGRFKVREFTQLEQIEAKELKAA